MMRMARAGSAARLIVSNVFRPTVCMTSLTESAKSRGIKCFEPLSEFLPDKMSCTCLSIPPRARLGEGDRGAKRRAGGVNRGQDYPSTALRAVPLPQQAGGGI